jgi:hypothetical protein
MAILYPVSEGACNDISVDGVNIPRTEDGGFDVPDQHVADVVTATGDALTSVRPDWVSAPAGKKAPKASKTEPEAPRAEG